MPNSHHSFNGSTTSSHKVPILYAMHVAALKAHTTAHSTHVAPHLKSDSSHAHTKFYTSYATQLGS